ADPRCQLWMASIWVAALLEFSISRVFLISLVTLFVAGYAQISFLAATNNRIQTIAPDHLRGRVMGLYGQALIGVGPLGATQAGLLATLFGAPWAMAIGAAVAGSVVLAVWLLRPAVFGHPSQTSSTAATASAGTSQRSARTLWAKIAIASSNAPPDPADLTRLERTGRTTTAGTAPVDPAR